MFLLWPQAYMFLPQHCFPWMFWRCDQSSERAKAEMLFMGRLSKDLIDFLYLSYSSLSQSFPKQQGAYFSSSTSPNWLSLLMKWLLSMSRHQRETIQPKAKFWRNSDDRAVLKLLQVKGVKSTTALKIYWPKYNGSSCSHNCKSQLICPAKRQSDTFSIIEQISSSI